MGSCFGTQKPRKIQPQWYDPLGPTSVDSRGKQVFAPSGAVDQRRAIFSDINRARQDLRASNTNEVAGKFANDPGWASARSMAGATARGDYLNGSPQLDTAIAKMRSANQAEGANAAANIRSQFERNGLNWSTANQQAQQAQQAGATAQSDAAEAAARLQNYQTERGYQMTAPGVLSEATSTPLNYLQLQDMAKLVPLSQMAQIIAGLAGQGQIQKPDLLQRQSKGRQFTAALGEIF